MISIILPIYNMKNAEFFLRRALNSIAVQTYKKFEVVISDNSPENSLEKIGKEYDFKIKYSRNSENIGMAGNTNKAMKFADGEIIKILYMDDYLSHNKVLSNIAKAFSYKNVMWTASHCTHDTGNGMLFNPHTACWNDQIHTGLNTVGSPSVVALRNQDLLFFDETMTWLLDCDYYKRMYEKYGQPKIINSYDIVIGIGEHQMTNILTDEEKGREHEYMTEKYEQG